VLAWGLGRPVMAVENITDIRQLYLSDLDWSRSARLVRRSSRCQLLISIRSLEMFPPAGRATHAIE